MSQADSLPDTITANIEGIEKLKGAENFDTWEFFALKTLKLYSLDGLLKGPRPSPTHVHTLARPLTASRPLAFFTG
jgi:hypothetical protein